MTAPIARRHAQVPLAQAIAHSQLLATHLTPSSQPATGLPLAACVQAPDWQTAAQAPHHQTETCLATGPPQPTQASLGADARLRAPPEAFRRCAARRQAPPALLRPADSQPPELHPWSAPRLLPRSIPPQCHRSVEAFRAKALQCRVPCLQPTLQSRPDWTRSRLHQRSVTAARRAEQMPGLQTAYPPWVCQPSVCHPCRYQAHAQALGFALL